MTHVLVVDDEVALLRAVSIALTARGYTVTTASNGAEGLEQLVSHQPDVVIIDVKMPELNGVNLVQAIRGDPVTAHIPLIILSALAQPRDIDIGTMAGADLYLTKPLNPNQLIAAIEQALTLSPQDREDRLRYLGQG